MKNSKITLGLSLIAGIDAKFNFLHGLSGFIGSKDKGVDKQSSELLEFGHEPTDKMEGVNKKMNEISESLKDLTKRIARMEESATNPERKFEKRTIFPSKSEMSYPENKGYEFKNSRKLEFSSIPHREENMFSRYKRSPIIMGSETDLIKSIESGFESKIDHHNHVGSKMLLNKVPIFRRNKNESISELAKNYTHSPFKSNKLQLSKTGYLPSSGKSSFPRRGFNLSPTPKVSHDDDPEIPENMDEIFSRLPSSGTSSFTRRGFTPNPTPRVSHDDDPVTSVNMNDRITHDDQVTPVNMDDIFSSVLKEDPIVEVKRFADFESFKRFGESVVEDKVQKEDGAVDTKFIRMSDILQTNNKNKLKNHSEASKVNPNELFNSLIKKDTKKGIEVTNKEISKSIDTSVLSTVFKGCNEYDNPTDAYEAGLCIFKTKSITTITTTTTFTSKVALKVESKPTTTNISKQSRIADVSKPTTTNISKQSRIADITEEVQVLRALAAENDKAKVEEIETKESQNEKFIKNNQIDQDIHSSISDAKKRESSKIDSLSQELKEINLNKNEDDSLLEIIESKLPQKTNINPDDLIQNPTSTNPLLE